MTPQGQPRRTAAVGAITSQVALARTPTLSPLLRHQANTTHASLPLLCQISLAASALTPKFPCSRRDCLLPLPQEVSSHGGLLCSVHDGLQERREAHRHLDRLGYQRWPDADQLRERVDPRRQPGRHPEPGDELGGELSRSVGQQLPHWKHVPELLNVDVLSVRLHYADVPDAMLMGRTLHS